MRVSDISKLRDEFHPSKNGSKRPEDFTYGSGVQLWWLCDKGHEYQNSPNQRTYYNQDCPYCSGRRVTPENNLEVCFPEISKEWDYDKNNGLNPKMYHPKSMKSAWFTCTLGHSYKTRIQDRTQKNSGCPRCCNKTSRPEMRLFSELSYLFPDSVHRNKIRKVEIDVFIPSINTGIEYDGHYYHHDKRTQDIKKNGLLVDWGINVIRVRETPLKPTGEQDIVIPKRKVLFKKDVNQILEKIINTVELNTDKLKLLEEYINEGRFQNEVHFNEYSKKPSIPKRDKSFLVTHPKESKFWDYEKNHPLRPEHFTYGSNVKVFWKCNRGHSYKTFIYFKGIKKTGCPICQRTNRSSSRTIRDIRQLEMKV